MNMKRTFRRSWTVVLAVFVVSALALPAQAGVETGEVVVEGTARVGNSIAPLASIPQNGVCAPSGKGLHAPGFGGGGKNRAKIGPDTPQSDNFQVNKEVYYRLDIDDINAVITDTNDAANSGVYTGTLDVCGIVSPGPGGIGAACGSSMGRDGKGKLILDNTVTGQDRIYDLQDVAWVLAVGGVLPVYGHITRVSANKLTKFSSKGTFEGEVTASGAGPCFDPKPGGAREFTVVGAVAAEALGKPAPKAREPKLAK
jgi:hypothetical protein